uniref:Secreted protein n=1 Tax=Strigamia maritima TaxID=126957 RepID=T1JGK9_STRMM
MAKHKQLNAVLVFVHCHFKVLTLRSLSCGSIDTGNSSEYKFFSKNFSKNLKFSGAVQKVVLHTLNSFGSFQTYKKKLF